MQYKTVIKLTTISCKIGDIEAGLMSQRDIRSEQISEKLIFYISSPFSLVTKARNVITLRLLLLFNPLSLSDLYTLSIVCRSFSRDSNFRKIRNLEISTIGMKFAKYLQ